jgi:hypothetical protein
VHAHLGATGGFYDDWSKFDPKKAVERALKAYLYCGVTAVRSAADTVDTMLEVRRPFGTGEKLGAELLLCGPIFTAEGGHGTQFAKFLPEPMRPAHNAQFVRLPKSPRRRDSKSTNSPRKVSTRSKVSSNRVPKGCRSTAWTLRS